jgi:hypothetical protein
MKKVLLGLVIAVMMTGSGYAKKSISDVDCTYIIQEAAFWVSQARINHEMGFRESSEDVSDIKRAHYFAVTWSALCD